MVRGTYIMVISIREWCKFDTGIENRVKNIIKIKCKILNIHELFFPEIILNFLMEKQVMAFHNFRLVGWRKYRLFFIFTSNYKNITLVPHNFLF